jgi:hypothetical protein
MVLVNRESVHLLDSEAWGVLGVYFLLGPSEDNDSDHYQAYVGEVGKSSLIQRTKQHAKQKEWWNRALLIASASGDFNSAEIGWLEGRLYDVLNNAVGCNVRNGNRPGDNSLHAHERALLERYVEPVVAALRACGAPVATADQKPPAPKKVRRYTESVADLVGAGLLKPDTVLEPLKKGASTTATVLSDGRLRVGDEVFDSPSAAAKAASGAIAEAGWDFWGAPSGAGNFVPLSKLRDRLRHTGAVRTSESLSPPLARRDRETGRVQAGAESDLTALASHAGLELPLRLFATYLGVEAEAFLHADGTIRFGHRSFASPSHAAQAARLALGYRGSGKAATNGWTWWRYEDLDGVPRRLNMLRGHRR